MLDVGGALRGATRDLPADRAVAWITHLSSEDPQPNSDAKV